MTPVRELRVVYEPVAGDPPGPRPRLTTPGSAVEVLRPLPETEAVEVFGVLLVNTKHEPLGWHVVKPRHAGTPPDVIKAACLTNAAAVIVAHNHPSGDPAPSPKHFLSVRSHGLKQVF